jgi:hypothetical protein
MQPEIPARTAAAASADEQDLDILSVSCTEQKKTRIIP